ncbi:MAG: hypothetical protein HGA41_10380 [Syntrophaceae bacterium]|nr:hypothetical protein [Syntrophaceae bacterium]
MKKLKLLGYVSAALISIILIPLPSFSADCNRPPSGSGSSWARACGQGTAAKGTAQPGWVKAKRMNSFICG